MAQTGADDLLRNLSNQMNSPDGSTSGDNSGQFGSNQQSQIRLSGSRQSTSKEPPSRLEKLFSVRAGVRLKQFGYDMLSGVSQLTVPLVGGVQDNYVLGPNDELVVTLRGQENSTYRTRVDREGRVLLPRLRPIPAAGRTLGDFRKELEQEVSRAFPATELYLSLGQLRQIGVTVVGEVKDPGLRILTGLSTPLDAILLSGGINKIGSLRNVRIVRDGKTIPYDLYSFLLANGHAPDIRLREGDRIVVPALSAVVAIAGSIRRPGIFELPPGVKRIGISSALRLAGGFELRGSYRLEILSTNSSGEHTLKSVSSRGSIQDSDVLFVQPSGGDVVEDIQVMGPTDLTGHFSLDRAPTMKALLSAPNALGSSPYMLFGLILRKNPDTYMRKPIAFAPVNVLNGRETVALQASDIVRVFNLTEMGWLGREAMAFKNRKESIASLTQTELAVANDNAYASGEDSLGASGVLDQDRLALKLAENDVLQGHLNPLGVYNRQRAISRARNNTSDNTQQEDGNQTNATTNRPQQQAITPGAVIFPNMAQTQNTIGDDTTQERQASSASTPAYQLSPNQSGGGQVVTGAQPFNPYAPPAQTAPNPYSLYSVNDVVASSSAALRPNAEVYNFDQLGRQLGIDPLILAQFFLDHRVTLSGAVRSPGAYIAASNITLDNLVSAAGGTISWADKSGVELVTTDMNPNTGHAETHRRLLKISQASLNTISLQPHDEVRFNKVFSDLDHGTVSIRGEVRYPGTYQILRGDKLSTILARAGGLSDDAYPLGTVFLRASQARIEREGLEQTASELRKQLMIGAARGELNSTAVDVVQSMIRDLRSSKTLGRLTVRADPVILAAHPNQDILLENSDTIYIPQRPSSITVLGEVQKPGAYVFQPSLDARDYIELAGGVGRYADDDYTFIVFPDGESRRLEASIFDLNSDKIPPGSVIVVPRDLTPYGTRQFLLDVTQFVQQWAVAAASLVVITR